MSFLRLLQILKTFLIFTTIRGESLSMDCSNIEPCVLMLGWGNNHLAEIWLYSTGHKNPIFFSFELFSRRINTLNKEKSPSMAYYNNVLFLYVRYPQSSCPNTWYSCFCIVLPISLIYNLKDSINLKMAIYIYNFQ